MEARDAIRGWVETTFADEGPKVFFELGAHQGEDTAWLSQIPGVFVRAYEPDPRNLKVLDRMKFRNASVTPAAISDYTGWGFLLLSDAGYGREEWTFSSSLKTPKRHLEVHPVTFSKKIRVRVTTLDQETRDVNRIDFIWADIQGAEREMIRGGLKALAKTRFLYTEYSDCEMYEGQPTLNEILEMLPDFTLKARWPEDALLENRRVA